MKRGFAVTTPRIGACLLALGCAFQVGGCHQDGGRSGNVPFPGQVAIAKTPPIIYADSDGFDAVLLAALMRRDKIIVVQTANVEPDWGPHLTAWIVAWSKGGPAPDPLASGTRSVVGLSPDLVAETRKIVTEESDRIERYAREAIAWWYEEQKRRERIDILKDYMLLTRATKRTTTKSCSIAKDPRRNKCRLSLRESAATFAERKATTRQSLIRRPKESRTRRRP